MEKWDSRESFQGLGEPTNMRTDISRSLNRPIRAALLVATVSLVAAATQPGCTTGTGTSTATPTLRLTSTPLPTSTTPPTSTATMTSTTTPPACGSTCIPSPVNTPVGRACLVPQQTPQTAVPINVPSGGYYWFDFQAAAGVTYTFSVCQNGGAFTGDPNFWLHGSACNFIVMNDNTCGLGSEIAHTATASGLDYLIVYDTSWLAFTATLAYWHN